MKKEKWKVFGDCTVPCGRKGPWSIERFTVTDSEARLFNLGQLMSHMRAFTHLDAGRYVRLRHAERGVVMSNTPMEIATNIDAYLAARGRVLINGLGLGMLLEGLLHKKDVTHARVIEIDAAVIGLVALHFRRDPRVEIIHADAMTYKPAPGEWFDYAWHDIWDSIDSDNLPAMATLGRRYSRRICTQQGWWARDHIRADVRSVGGRW